jgi:hypothetical protein
MHRKNIQESKINLAKRSLSLDIDIGRAIIKAAMPMSISIVALTGWTLESNLAHAAEPKREEPKAVDWAAAAQTDIDWIYATLRDNHPGPPDPERRRFAAWLEEGRTITLSNAKLASSQADYWRAVRGYTNGFRDGHIWFAPSHPAFEWPGFLTQRGDDGRARVTVNSGVPQIPLGAQLIECDGSGADALLQRLVNPYQWNADIPHERNAASVFLFAPLANDPLRPQACQFAVQGRVFSHALLWKAVSLESRNDLLNKASGSVPTALGLRQVGGVWFVSLPTFNFQGDGAAAMQALLKKLQVQAKRLHAARWVVLDVRGNTGGNSGWGSDVAKALYGDAAIDRIEGQFDWTVDWRASAQNAASLRYYASVAQNNGQEEDARNRIELAEALEQAAQKGQTYWRQNEPHKVAAKAPQVASPFKGRVFLLTDNACASACLDFADIARRLPGVVHVGLPTSADAVYIDNTGGELPSGQGNLSYSMKVYRNRIRGHNEWYEPAVRWPGGPMADKALAVWVRALKR